MPDPQLTSAAPRASRGPAGSGRRRRARTIRRRVAAGAVAGFLATWLLIAIELTTGHDPALASRKAATVASSSTGASAASTSTASATTTGSGGSTGSATTTGSGGSTGSSGSTGSGRSQNAGSGSSTAASSVTTRQS